MARAKEFKTIPPARKPDLVVRTRRAQAPILMVEHISLGLGKLLHVRVGEGGRFVADVEFLGRNRRVLRLEQKFFSTKIEDIVAMSTFPPLKSKPEPAEEKKTKRLAEDDEEVEESETQELDAESAFRGEQSAVEDDADEESGDGAELEEIA
jgi:hypothetical protein